MFRKPFKPPLLQRRPQIPQEPPREDVEVSGPPAKKRRISQGTQDEPPEATKVASSASPAATVPRKPLLSVRNSVTAADVLKQPVGDGAEGYYTVLWYASNRANFKGVVPLTSQTGASLLPRNTRHGMEMASSPSAAAVPISTTFPAGAWARRAGLRLCCRVPHCQSEARTSR